LHCEAITRRRVKLEDKLNGNQDQDSDEPKGGLSELKISLAVVLGQSSCLRAGRLCAIPGIEMQRVGSQLFWKKPQTPPSRKKAPIVEDDEHRSLVVLLGVLQVLSVRDLCLYITASIIVLAFRICTLRLMELKKEGEAGKRKISQYTRYLTFGC